MQRSLLAAAVAFGLALTPLAALSGPISSYPVVSPAPADTVAGTQVSTGNTSLFTAGSIAAIPYTAAGSWTQPQTFPAPGASKGSIVLTPGTVSGTPPNGSLWTTSGGLFFQAGGATQQVVGNGANTWSDVQTFPAPGASKGSVVLTPGSESGTAPNGSLWATSAGLFAQIGGSPLQFATTGANTWGGKQSFAASTLSSAGVSLGQGSGPTSPANGDLWITSSGVFARVNGSTAALGVTVPTAAAGGSNTQLQYNCSSVLCGATGFAYTAGATDRLTGPDGTTWGTGGLVLASTSKIDVNGAFIMSSSTPLIGFCSGSWLIGPDNSFCSRASGGDNIGIGTIVFGALTTGHRNVAVGSENNRNLTTAIDNTSIGFEAGHFIVDGTDNTAVGVHSLDQVTSGTFNLGLGPSAGTAITTGGSNICIWATCGASATLTGSHNTMIGTASGTVTSGSNNIFIGNTAGGAGQGIVTGTGNVFIGRGTGTLTDQSDSITVADGDGNTLSQYTTAQGYLKFFHPIEPPSFAGSTGLLGTPFVLGGTTVVGTGAAVACASGSVCDSIQGRFTLTTGTGVSAAGVAVTVNMAITRTNTPACVVSAFKNASGDIVSNWAESTTTLPISSATQLASSTTYTGRYICGGI
ncbi:MAG TPA: hypothetical protein VGG29_00255 [Caulobacteraceae bacterium]|jgi:hypothetical protein